MALLIPIAGLTYDSPAAAQNFGETRQYFGDWLAACRPDGYCSATAYQNPSLGNGTVADYVLRVGRHAEQTWWEVSLTTVATMADGAATILASIDGEPIEFSGRAEFGAYGAVNDFFFLGDKAQQLLDRLGPGQSIAFDFTDEAGASRRADFSLNGLTASLIWIDEQQRRLGSERVAEAPPYGLTPVGEGTAVTPVPVALLDLHALQRDCEPLELLPHGRDITTGKLTGGDTLYLLPCFAGAYNFSYLGYVGSSEDYRQIYFLDYSENAGWMGTPFAVNPSFDPDTGTLATFTKGRGIGDCGSTGEWRWSEFQFQLIRFTAKDACDGQGGVDEYPVVFERSP